MKIQKLIDLLNKNEGTLTLVLFIVSIIFGWISGIFRSLLKKPKFKIRIIPKMTFGTVYLTGERYTPPGQGTYDLHITAIVVYLEITNIGSAPSNLGKIKIGYYKDDGKSTLFQKRLWVPETNIFADFIIPSADGQEIVVPHLRQKNPKLGEKYNGYLEVGQSIIGAAYFEQQASWGNHYPREESNTLELKIQVKDAFDDTYSKIARVPLKTLKECLRYNSKFGFTMLLFDKDELYEEHNDNSKEQDGGVK